MELCEILDVSERGMCIQAATTMKMNRLLPLVLDLSETRTRLYTTGHVVWSDPYGKTGIRFPEMPEASRTQFQQWLATDVAAVGVSSAEANTSAAAPASDVPIQARPRSRAAYTSLVNEWSEIQNEVDVCGSDLDAALSLIAQRALTLTWASGAAVALINKLKPSELICVARAGTDSPELGSRLQAGAGFSGECVRAATSLNCDDALTDPRVDRNSCHALGIRSLIACPIKRRRGEVIGILEVLSPEPSAFWDNDNIILERLSRIIAKLVSRGEPSYPQVREVPAPAVEESPSLFTNTLESFENQEFVSQSSSFSRKVVLLATGMVAIIATTWLISPWIEDAISKISRSGPQAAEASPLRDAYIGAKLPDLKQLAANGVAGAQYSLGMRYATGDGVLKDYREAVAWFLKAADQGEARATSKLAACYWAGRGAPQDYGKAYFWGLLAQAAGDETGRVIVINSAPHLSPAHIAREQQQADKWLHDHGISSQSAPEPAR